MDVLIHCVQGEARVSKQNRAMKGSDDLPRLVSTHRRLLITRFCSGSDVFLDDSLQFKPFPLSFGSQRLTVAKTQEKREKGLGVRGQSQGSKGERMLVHGVQTPEHPRIAWEALKTQVPRLGDSQLEVRPGRLHVRLDLWGDFGVHHSERITEQCCRGLEGCSLRGMHMETWGPSRTPPTSHDLI